MKAALMWTISDFPGYAMLSGWSTNGRLACPACNKETYSQWLKYGRKFCYLGHRRFLPSRHVFRRYKKSFDNQQEFRPPPKSLSGSDVLADLQGRQIKFGKKSKNNHLPYAWKKRSIFFDLPYWVDNLLRHNLDVMHIEKNVCDNILWTLLNVNGRSKDSVKSRLDLQLMGIRDELHPQRHESGKMYVPPACFTLSAKERQLLCKALKGVKVPDGYAANISRCVNLKQRKIAPLKSHDSHILMQQLLPLMLRRLLPKPISGPLIQLCSFFKDLCSKTGEVDKLIRLEGQISLTLCQLERIFPPSFFDVMVHLTVHLVSEVKLGGPVQGRWMYPVERFLSTLKSYVGNKAQPEGSVTEGYFAEECLTFCSRYLKGVETRFNRTPRNEDNTYGTDFVNQEVDSFFQHSGRPIGKGELVVMDNESLAKAHQYVLANCPLVTPFIECHLALLRSQYPRATPHAIQAKHHSTFQSWFSDQIICGTSSSMENFEELKHLARSPNNVVQRFNGFIINGYRFHNKEMERKRKTQNSGVMITATTQSYASTRDRNPVYSDIIYYGVIQEIFEMEYWINRKIVLFKCDWVSTSRGVKQDDFGFTLVNFSRRMSENEPFILATQAQQVFYVADTMDNDWKVVIKTTPRNLCDLSEQEQVADVETYLQSETLNAAFSEDLPHEDDVNWARDGMHGDLVDATVEIPVGEPSNIQETEGEDSEVNENTAYDY
ncbi:hypothetical protein LINPERHAP1_LOCUS28970 [Linum perenne]